MLDKVTSVSYTHLAWAITEGVTYNFYINDTKIESGIVAGFYNCDSKYFTTVGDYKISVTAEKNGYESDKSTINFKVTKAVSYTHL